MVLREKVEDAASMDGERRKQKTRHAAELTFSFSATVQGYKHKGLTNSTLKENNVEL